MRLLPRPSDSSDYEGGLFNKQELFRQPELFFNHRTMYYIYLQNSNLKFEMKATTSNEISSSGVFSEIECIYHHAQWRY